MPKCWPSLYFRGLSYGCSIVQIVQFPKIFNFQESNFWSTRRSPSSDFRDPVLIGNLNPISDGPWSPPALKKSWGKESVFIFWIWDPWAEIWPFCHFYERDEFGAKSIKWENCYVSAQGPPIQNIKVLSFLQLLKLKNRKWHFFFFGTSKLKYGHFVIFMKATIWNKIKKMAISQPRGLWK